MFYLLIFVIYNNLYVKIIKNKVFFTKRLFSEQSEQTCQSCQNVVCG
jgi:hypothetical protein